MMKLVSNQKGVTLIELVVGMFLLSLIIGAASIVLVPTMAAYDAANNLAEVNTLLDNLANEIVNEMNRATEIVILDDSIRINDFIEYGVNDDGLLYRNSVNNPVFEKEFYKNKTVDLEFSESGVVYTVEITIQPLGRSREYAVSPIGLEP
jgi:prepilin-type N-terminal cleavage/methylation domain-containing protein